MIFLHVLAYMLHFVPIFRSLRAQSMEQLGIYLRVKCVHLILAYTFCHDNTIQQERLR